MLKPGADLTSKYSNRDIADKARKALMQFSGGHGRFYTCICLGLGYHCDTIEIPLEYPSIYPLGKGRVSQGYLNGIATPRKNKRISGGISS